MGQVSETCRNQSKRSAGPDGCKKRPPVWLCSSQPTHYQTEPSLHKPAGPGPAPAASSSSSAKWVTATRCWLHPTAAAAGTGDMTGVYVRLKITTTTAIWLDRNRGNLLISDSEGSFWSQCGSSTDAVLGNFIRYGFSGAALHRPSLHPARKRVREKRWSEAGTQREFLRVGPADPHERCSKLVKHPSLPTYPWNLPQFNQSSEYRQTLFILQSILVGKLLFAFVYLSPSAMLQPLIAGVNYMAIRNTATYWSTINQILHVSSSSSKPTQRATRATHKSQSVLNAECFQNDCLFLTI